MNYDTQIQGEQMNINTSFFFFYFILSSQACPIVYQKKKAGPMNRSFDKLDRRGINLDHKLAYRPLT